MNSKRLRLAFAGTPELAAVVLESLLQNTSYSVEIVYTQPDRPAGRGRKPKMSPVKQLALEHGLSVEQPLTSAEIDPVARLKQLDVLVVVAYGMILPGDILHRPHYGCLNIHTSLLPRWRGAAPIQRAIQAGDKETGVSIMQMDEGLDTGPVYLQRSCPIDADETAGSLHDKLAKLGADCLIEVLEHLQSGGLKAEPQDESLATYAHKISKAEAQIDWQKSADELECMVRAFIPYPVAYTQLNDLDIRIWSVDKGEPTNADSAPGQILACCKDGIEVACGQGSLIIRRLQIPGKRPMSVAEFLNGHPEFHS